MGDARAGGARARVVFHGRRKRAGGAWAPKCRKQAPFAVDFTTKQIQTNRLSHAPPQRPRKRRYIARTMMRLGENRLTPGRQKRSRRLRPAPQLPGRGGFPRAPPK